MMFWDTYTKSKTPHEEEAIDDKYICQQLDYGQDFDSWVYSGYILVLIFNLVYLCDIYKLCRIATGRIKYTWYLVLANIIVHTLWAGRKPTALSFESNTTIDFSSSSPQK